MCVCAFKNELEEMWNLKLKSTLSFLSSIYFQVEL